MADDIAQALAEIGVHFDTNVVARLASGGPVTTGEAGLLYDGVKRNAKDFLALLARIDLHNSSKYPDMTPKQLKDKMNGVASVCCSLF
jgi:hypothetical protein